MKKSRFSEAKIIDVLREAEAGAKFPQLCRCNGISEATYYNRTARYGGMDVPQLRLLKELEAENARRKRMYADLSLTLTRCSKSSQKRPEPAPAGGSGDPDGQRPASRCATPAEQCGCRDPVTTHRRLSVTIRT